MSEKLTILSQITNHEALISFEGVIDEDAQFEKIRNLNLKQYIFDFDKITMINSCGIREWIKYLDEFNGANIIYKNCPQIIIEQINMVHGFIKRGTVIESFYAPYFCETCDDQKKLLLKSVDIIDGHAPKVNCVKCSSELEFDAIEKQYFAFLNQGK